MFNLALVESLLNYFTVTRPITLPPPTNDQTYRSSVVTPLPYALSLLFNCVIQVKIEPCVFRCEAWCVQ
jgi:hypothetical protein